MEKIRFWIKIVAFPSLLCLGLIMLGYPEMFSLISMVRLMGIFIIVCAMQIIK